MLHLFLFFACLLMSTCSCAFGYYSQSGQDEYVHRRFFQGLQNGIFVDIGANDGISLSNSYFFEKDLNWTGLCIEPIPEAFSLLQKNRTCACLRGCIDSENKKAAPFVRIHGPLEMLSGLWHKYHPRHWERVQRELEVCGGSYEMMDVDCYNLNDLLQEHGLYHIDFLSLDTEGGELEILKSIDFNKFQIDVITVENNYNDPNFVLFMQTQGYYLAKKLEQDQVFVHRYFKRERR